MKNATYFTGAVPSWQGESAASQINGDDLDNFLLSISQEKSSLRQKNENPELVTQGFRDVEEPETPQLDTYDTSSITYLAPASSEMIACETGMTYDTGYIRLPRSLLNDPRLVEAPVAYYRVLIQILTDMCYAPTEFNDGGNIIKLSPGQLVITHRGYAEKFSKEIDRNVVRRTIDYFEKLKIVSQSVSHRKSIITVIHKETCDLIKSCREPRSEPKASQERAIKEEGKERKKKNVCYPAGAGCGIVRKSGPDGEIRIDQSDILRQLMGEMQFSTSQFQEAWMVLANYSAVVYNPYLFVKQTLENIIIKEKSQNIKKAQAKAKACNTPKSSKSVSTEKPPASSSTTSEKITPKRPLRNLQEELRILKERGPGSHVPPIFWSTSEAQE